MLYICVFKFSCYYSVMKHILLTGENAMQTKMTSILNKYHSIVYQKYVLQICLLEMANVKGQT